MQGKKRFREVIERNLGIINLQHSVPANESLKRLIAASEVSLDDSVFGRVLVYENSKNVGLGSGQTACQLQQ